MQHTVQPATGPDTGLPAALGEHRPWGWFDVLARRSGFQVKRICVEASGRLSLQRHRHRREHWYVLEGLAEVEIDGARLWLGAGQSVDIPHMVWHRLRNAGEHALVILEIQQGGYLGEDDIERLEDDYGRACGSAAA